MAWGSASGASDWVSKLRKNDPTLNSLYILPFRRMAESDWVELCGAIEQNTELTELMASGHTLAPAAVAAFASLLEKNGRIVKFGVGNEALGDDGMCGLAPGIAKSRSVVHLEMDMKGMGERGCEALAKALGDNRSVRRLNLARNKLGDAGVLALAQGLAANGETVRELDLTETGVGAEGLGALASVLAGGGCGVETIVLSGNEGITPDATVELWEAMCKGKCNVQAVSLGGCESAWDGQAVDRMAAALLKEGASITKVVLDGAAFGKLGLCEEAGSCIGGSTSVQVASLKDCCIGDRGVRALSESATPSTRLKSLDLMSNELTHLGMSDLLLCPLLKLERISMLNNKLGDSGVVALAAALCQEASNREVCPFLEDLDLGANDLSEEGALSLFRAIVDHPMLFPSLKTLGLGAHKNIEGESAEWEEAVEALKGRKVPLAAIWQVGFGNEGKEAEAGHRQQMEAMSGGTLAPG